MSDIEKAFNDPKWRNMAEEEIGEGGTHFLYFVAGYRCGESEFKAIFDLQQTRMERATKVWQKATGNNCLPDLGQLLDWLLSTSKAEKKRASDLEAENARMREALEHALRHQVANLGEVEEYYICFTYPYGVFPGWVSEARQALSQTPISRDKSGEINPDGVEYGCFKLDGEFPS